MKTGGFSLIRIGGIEVLVDYSWVVMFFVVTVITENSFSQIYPDHSTAFYWFIGAIVSILVFLSVLIRELAHAFAATRFGIRITNMRLHIFGCPVLPDPRSGRHEFLIAIAGLAANVVVGSFCLAVYAYFWYMQHTTPIRGIAAYLASANFLLAAVHMIPGFPLDGGRILRAILWDRWNDMARATRIVSQIGNGLGLFFIIFGILQFLVTQSMVAGLLFLVGLFMKQSSAVHFRSVVEQRSLANVQVQQVMSSNVVTVDWLVSVDNLIKDYFYKYRFKNIPVCNRDDIIGMVYLNGVKSVSKDLWTFKQVRDIMVSIEDVLCTRPDTDAAEVLKKMESEKIVCMPVMQDNRLVGIITRSDILKLFRIKSDLGIT